MRRLRVTQRRVAPDAVPAYQTAWQAVADAAASVDARAWLFQGASDAGLFCEFIEWKDEAGNVMERDVVRQATSRLDEFGRPMESGVWQEPRPGS